jgi:phosphoglycolate phosphatase-like HAD superfamily hydrolase
MVGDTEMDIMLGRNSDVYQTVGVLSGSGDEQDLRDADIILNSVVDLIDSGVLDR